MRAYFTRVLVNAKSPFPPTNTASQQAWYDGLPVSHPVLTELLDVPSLPLQSAGQHGTDLIEQETSCGRASESTNYPEAGPLDPLAEVVREQNVMEQTVLGQHVHLLHTLDGLIVLDGLLTLATERRSADFAQVVVVEDVAQQSPAPDDQADFNAVKAPRPVVYSGRTVASEPAGQTKRICEVEGEGGQEDQGVDGRHAGVHEERGKDRAVGVVD